MKLKKNWLLYLAVLVSFAIPLAFNGTAMAVRYNPDGAVQNPVTGVYELPADIGACFDGTATINPSYHNRPDCLAAPNPTLLAITTKSVCQTPVQITSPAGYDLNSGTASWGACSNYNLRSDPAACIGGGWSWDSFTRCSKQLTNTDCTSLGTQLGKSVTAGGTSSTPTCTTTVLTAVECAAGGTVTSSSTPWMGSAAVSGGTTTCTIYIGNDAAKCSAVGGGTISTTSTDETRGFCSNSWVFKQVAGTGATATATGTGGSLTTVEARSCLRCHNSTYQGEGSPFAEPEKYIKASHRNSSRKITAGKNWAQINENSGSEAFGVFTNYANRAIDWVNGLIETAAGSGIFTNWYWYWGYYFEDPSAGSDIAENTTGTTGVPWNVITSRSKGGFQACMYCHGTGFSAENTLNIAKEPEKSFPGIAWDGSVPYNPATNGAVNLRTSFNNRSNVDDSAFVPSTNDCTALGGTISGTGSSKKCINTTITENQCVQGGNSIPGTPDWSGAWIGSWNSSTKCTITIGYKYNSWDEFGVLCSNCHNAVDGGHNNSSTGYRKNVPRPTVAQPSYGAQVNAVCLQCHAKAGSSNAQNTAMDSEPLANKSDVGSGHPNYHGSQFMNSPHARFTGTYSQVTDTTKYDSAFATNYGGCEGCHDPHGSVRENLLDPAIMGSEVAEEGIKRTCASCHSTYSDSDTATITTINHPTGINTPMGDVSAPTDGCVICHMPGNSHLFRISVDNVAQKADGTYTDAVWNTAATVCQQCHKAGGAAVAFSADQAKAGAVGMHSGGSSDKADCLACHAVGNTVGAPEINPGVNHHGKYGECIDCHQQAHNGGTIPDKHSNSFCLSCHTNTGPHAVHHAVSTVTVECASCHTTPGVLTADQENTTVRDTVTAQCMGCHATAQTRTTTGTTRALIVSGTGDNHHRGSNPTTTPNSDPKFVRIVAGCLYCHSKGLPFGSANTEVMQDQRSAGGCNGACHSSTLPTSGQHHTGLGLAPTDGFICLSCHKPGQPGAPGVTDSAVWPVPTWVDCSACHSSGGTNGPSTNHHLIPEGEECESCHAYAGVKPVPTKSNSACLVCHSIAQGEARAVDQGTDHHYGTCTTCHPKGGDSAADFDANSINSITTACLTCHSGAVTQSVIAGVSDGGSLPAIVPDVNHHRGKDEATAGFIGCLACHGPSGGVNFWKGPVAGDCTICHGQGTEDNIIQANPGQNHHRGECVGCHKVDGSFSGAPAAGVITGQDAVCGTCHTTTPVSLINHPTKPRNIPAVCQNCHQAGGFKPTFVTACTPCHGGAAGPAAAVAPAPYLTAAKLVTGAAGMHKNVAPKAIMTLIATDAAAKAGVQVKVNANVQVKDGSTDANGNLSTIVVAWGDGKSSTIAPGATTPVYKYTKTGARTITLTAIDSKGLKSSATVKITVIK